MSQSKGSVNVYIYFLTVQRINQMVNSFIYLACGIFLLFFEFNFSLFRLNLKIFQSKSFISIMTILEFDVPNFLNFDLELGQKNNKNRSLLLVFAVSKEFSLDQLLVGGIQTCDFDAAPTDNHDMLILHTS